MGKDDSPGLEGTSLPLEAQAASRYIRRQTARGAPLEESELQAWLSDPAHAHAFRAVEEAWRVIGTHERATEVQRYRDDALQRAHRARSTPRKSWGVGLAAALLCAAALGMVLAGRRVVTYRTGIGEQRVVELPDRSRIALDAGSELRVRMTRRRRVADLLDGQVQFQVAHDPQRPFLVKVAGNTITAVGTSFNVEYLDRRMQVDMVEGKVAVTIAAPAIRAPGVAAGARQPAVPANPILDLVAGEELSIEPGGRPQVVRDADIDAAIAWRHGKILFKDALLGEAVRRLNRYSSLQLQVSDPTLARERISGVFDLGDTMVFAEAVQSSLPAVLRQSGPNLLVLSRAP